MGTILFVVIFLATMFLLELALPTKKRNTTASQQTPKQASESAPTFAPFESDFDKHLKRMRD